MTAEEKIQKVADFCPINDVFFEVLANDNAVCQEMLRVILEDNALVVENVIVQSSEQNIYGRSVRLDALCILSDGKRVNIEVQRSDNDNHFKRVRFNSASITVKESEKGKKFENVVDVYVIYISEFDIFKAGRTIYHVDKIVRETGEVMDDGSGVIFVNTANNDGTDVAELMECFTQKEVNNPKFPELSKRMFVLKHTEGGASTVCEVMDKYINEAEIKGAIKAGVSLNASKETIVSNLIKEYGLSEQEAIAKYDEHAPVVK